MVNAFGIVKIQVIKIDRAKSAVLNFKFKCGYPAFSCVMYMMSRFTHTNP